MRRKKKGEGKREEGGRKKIGGVKMSYSKEVSKEGMINVFIFS